MVSRILFGNTTGEQAKVASIVTNANISKKLDLRKDALGVLPDPALVT
jgi:hypothetical protein